MRLFEKDLLKKLYFRTVKVLFGLNNAGNNPTTTYIGGDFSEKNFSEKDFHVGYPIVRPPVHDDYFFGDFVGDDFFDKDFYLGYLVTIGKDYSVIFLSILNMFDEINTHNPDKISDEDKQALNEALEAVLAAFRELQDY
ncbi:hypothetical protein [Pedobacter sp. NJ-S-72]